MNRFQYILNFKFYGKDVSMTYEHGDVVPARLAYDSLQTDPNVTDLSFNQKLISSFNPDPDKGPVGWIDKKEW